MVFVKSNDNSHRRSAIGGWVPHDDALRNTQNFVVLSVRRCIEKMVGRLLERRKHQHGVFHLRHTEARDTEDLSLPVKGFERLVKLNKKKL